MSATLEYLRPTTLDEALALLRRPGMRTVPLAGGVWLVPRLRRDVDVPDPLAEAVDAVVDLAELNLSFIAPEGRAGDGWLRLGAATPLEQISASAVCREFAGGLLAQAAQRAMPLNQRNAATLAGVVLGDESTSELLLALLVLDAQVAIAAEQPALVALDALRVESSHFPAGGLMTEIRLTWPSETVQGGMARVARTPADRPIVAAAALGDKSGRRLALGGVADKPLLLRLRADDDLEQALEAKLAKVALLSDWQGSAEYRRAMALVLGRRALAQVAIENALT